MSLRNCARKVCSLFIQAIPQTGSALRVLRERLEFCCRSGSFVRAFALTARRDFDRILSRAAITGACWCDRRKCTAVPAPGREVIHG